MAHLIKTSGRPFPLHIWLHLMPRVIKWMAHLIPTPTPGPKFSPRRKSRGVKSPSGFIAPKPRPIPNLLVLGHENSICEKSIFWCQVVRPLFFESLPCLKIPAREPFPTAHLASFDYSFDCNLTSNWMHIWAWESFPTAHLASFDGSFQSNWLPIWWVDQSNWHQIGCTFGLGSPFPLHIWFHLIGPDNQIGVI